MKVELCDMTLKEVRDEGPFEVAVLPWGACEPHNMHLPYGCDALAVEKIAEISAGKAKTKGAKVVVLPTIPIGINTNTMAFPMTLNFSPTTQLKMLVDIVEALEIHKVYKLIILNGHGGNEFKFMARELHRKTKVHIFLLNWWGVRQDIVDEVSDDKSGEHAHEAETSWFMYLYPELVHLEWADEGKVKEPVLKGLIDGTLIITRPWHLLTTNAGYGNPKKATAEKGKRIVEGATDKIADVIKELSDAKVNEKFPF
jgi:creatinine amidohydrolase